MTVVMPEPVLPWFSGSCPLRFARDYPGEQQESERLHRGPSVAVFKMRELEINSVHTFINIAVTSRRVHSQLQTVREW